MYIIVLEVRKYRQKVMQKYNTNWNYYYLIQIFIMNMAFFVRNVLFIINYKKGVHL